MTQQHNAARLLRDANENLAKLGVEIVEKSKHTVELTAIGQKPVQLTRTQLRAIAEWANATQDAAL